MLIESLILQYEEALCEETARQLYAELYQAIAACEEADLLARLTYPDEELASLAQSTLTALKVPPCGHSGG